MTDPTAARGHVLHAELVISVCHTPPQNGRHGLITPRLSFLPGLTPVTRLQLLRAALHLVRDQRATVRQERAKEHHG